MLPIPDKTNATSSPGNALDAEEVNSVKTELENVVKVFESLTGTDNTQVVRAINLLTKGFMYTPSTSNGNTIELTRPFSNALPDSIVDNSTFMFTAVANNTSSSVTITIGNYGPLSVVNGVTGNVLTADYLSAGNVYILVYDEAQSLFKVYATGAGSSFTKANKVSGPTIGGIAILDSDGDISDSDTTLDAIYDLINDKISILPSATLYGIPMFNNSGSIVDSGNTFYDLNQTIDSKVAKNQSSIPGRIVVFDADTGQIANGSETISSILTKIDDKISKLSPGLNNNMLASFDHEGSVVNSGVDGRKVSTLQQSRSVSTGDYSCYAILGNLFDGATYIQFGKGTITAHSFTSTVYFRTSFPAMCVAVILTPHTSDVAAGDDDELTVTSSDVGSFTMYQEYNSPNDRDISYIAIGF